jgi:putative colanic acid biosynthesis acetyltransferase WcaB
MSFFYFIFQDWQVNSSKGRIIILLFRIANFCSTRRVYYYIGLPYLIFYKILVEWILCIEIPWNVQIGKNFRLFHGQSLVLSRDVIIGNNCTLRHCTTIGNKQIGHNEFSASPIIGDNVDIGSNVCIIGNIRISDNVKVGCGAVVTKNVVENSTVVGNPATVKIRVAV